MLQRRCADATPIEVSRQPPLLLGVTRLRTGLALKLSDFTAYDTNRNRSHGATSSRTQQERYNDQAAVLIDCLDLYAIATNRQSQIGTTEDTSRSNSIGHSMRASILIAAHNEGDLLWRTVASCREASEALPAEIVVVDDGSTDDCIQKAMKRFDNLRVFGFGNRLGPSPTKDRAARESTGDVLIFLDAHCKPELGALECLVEDVEKLQGQAIITPAVAPLDTEQWANQLNQLGHGYGVDLENFEWKWLPVEQMRPHNEFLESPSLIGCCLALTRRLYDKLWGFDPDMYGWGVEDVDFGVKSWIMGHPVLADPKAIVGHRFQKAFTTYAVSEHFILANRLRMAYKILPAGLWPGWLDRVRSKQQDALWRAAWELFTLYRGSAELERAYLRQNQKQDLYAYAARFGLPWPSMN